MTDENIVYIGDKEIGKYFVAVMTQLDKNDEVHVKGRGRSFIGKAVDVAELVRRDRGQEIADISTGTNRKCGACDNLLEDGSDKCPDCGEEDELYGSSTIDILVR